jgi:hypothetical protein
MILRIAAKLITAFVLAACGVALIGAGAAAGAVRRPKLPRAQAQEAAEVFLTTSTLSRSASSANSSSRAPSGSTPRTSSATRSRRATSRQPHPGSTTSRS